MFRRAIQRNGRQMQLETPLEDKQTETDELFQNAGKIGEKHVYPADPLVIEVTDDGGMGLRRTIFGRLLGALVGRAGRFGCEWFIGRGGKCWKSRSVGCPVLRPWF